MKYGHFDEAKKEYVIDRTTLVRLPMVRLSPIMQVVTALKRVVRTEELSVTSSTALTSREDMYT